MSMKIYDSVFTRDPQPAVVVDRRTDNGQMVLSADQKIVRDKHRHGYINGLEKKEREQLNSILDAAKMKENPKERLFAMQKALNNIQKDPHNYNVVRYLEGEIAHIKNSFNIKPKTYTASEIDIA